MIPLQGNCNELSGQKTWLGAIAVEVDRICVEKRYKIGEARSPSRDGGSIVQVVLQLILLYGWKVDRIVLLQVLTREAYSAIAPAVF